MEDVAVVGLDLAKSVFQVHGVDAAGKVVLRRRLSRSKLLSFFTALPPCLIGMETCASANFWARELMAFGHEVRLMPPRTRSAYARWLMLIKEIRVRNNSSILDAERIALANRHRRRWVQRMINSQQRCRKYALAHIRHNGEESLIERELETFNFTVR